MARQTRQQRRARRAQQTDSGGAIAATAGAPPAPPQRRPTARAGEFPEPRRVPGGGFLNFIRESIGELKKVEWPGQKQVIAGTAVVLIACVIVGTYLWVNDLIWQRFVENVLLK